MIKESKRKKEIDISAIPINIIESYYPNGITNSQSNNISDYYKHILSVRMKAYPDAKEYELFRTYSGKRYLNMKVDDFIEEMKSRGLYPDDYTYFGAIKEMVNYNNNVEDIKISTLDKKDSYLLNYPNITTLILTPKSVITDKGLSYVPYLEKLQVNSIISDAGLKHLNNLKELIIPSALGTDTNITEGGIIKLYGHRKKDYLSLIANNAGFDLTKLFENYIDVRDNNGEKIFESTDVESEEEQEQIDLETVHTTNMTSWILEDIKYMTNLKVADISQVEDDKVEDVINQLNLIDGLEAVVYNEELQSEFVNNVDKRIDRIPESSEEGQSIIADLEINDLIVYKL